MTTELTIKTEQQITPAQIDLIKKTVAVGATDDELKLYLYQAQKRGLDPLTRQIHLIKRKRWNEDKKAYDYVATIQTGIDGFRLIADRSGKLAGIKRGVILNDKGELTRAWAEIYRKDWNEPAREEVSFKEYCQKDKEGNPISLWKTMPETMLKIYQVSILMTK
jgi:phage recombination protein Bet